MKESTYDEHEQKSYQEEEIHFQDDIHLPGSQLKNETGKQEFITNAMGIGEEFPGVGELGMGASRETVFCVSVQRSTRNFTLSLIKKTYDNTVNPTKSSNYAKVKILFDM